MMINLYKMQLLEMFKLKEKETRMRKILVLLIILLCLLVCLGLLIFLLTSGGDTPSHSGPDYHQHKTTNVPQNLRKANPDADYNSDEYGTKSNEEDEEEERPVGRNPDGSLFGGTLDKSNSAKNPRIDVRPELHPFPIDSDSFSRSHTTTSPKVAGLNLIAPSSYKPSSFAPFPSTHSQPEAVIEPETSSTATFTFTPSPRTVSSQATTPSPSTTATSAVTTPSSTTTSDDGGKPTVAVRVINPVWVGEKPLPDIATRFAKPTAAWDEVRPTCFEHMLEGHGTGIYYLDPEGRGDKFIALCDMETDGGGWTVVQKRINKKVNFHKRIWEEYEKGFGDIEDSFWLGLKKIARLAPLEGEELRMRIEVRGDTCKKEKKNAAEKCSGLSDAFWWAEYGFKLGDASTNYVLHLSTPLRGNLSVPGSTLDPFYLWNKGKPFTTIDRDNDDFSEGNCAIMRNFGGWWHSNCTQVALNGVYGDVYSQTRYMVFAHEEYHSDGRLKLKYNIHPKQSVIMIRRMY
ncbi:hypothetical protein WR25_06539 [Diploscapter pachys]|uniref:Fibrinogen C-terminal domain-containing protein n=1 Tax=Diploscapter pachys TaxID=2018661 RepID=A0A2A2LWN7_9BILA|nr:hypothetical protein WR25_06539 [Diploscapter pachys]